MPALRGVPFAVLPLLLAAQESLWIDVPFVRQPAEGCGAAAISMLVRYWQHHDPTIADAAANTLRIQDQLYVPEQRGIPAAAMAAYFTGHGFRAFDFEGEWKDLEQHISLGRPLIACLAPEPGAPLHYVVIAGVGTDRVVLNDPSAGKLVRVDRLTFERRWGGCNHWTLLAVPEARQAAMPRGNATPAVGDAYANERLATLHFVEGNYDAALKYWNRVGKPRLDEIRFTPQLPLDPLLKSRLLPLSETEVLTLDKLRYTRRLLGSLGFLQREQTELVALPEQRYELEIRTSARSSFPHPVSVFGGAMFLTFHFDFYNLRETGRNWTTMVRADARKRRLLTSFEAPLAQDPKWRYSLFADARREVWNTGAADFRLNRTESGVDFRLIASGRLEWGSGFHVSTRDYGGAQSLLGGTALEYATRFDWRLLDSPESGVTVDSDSRWKVARMVTGTRQLYSLWQTSLGAQWRPRAGRSPYMFAARAGAGASAGTAPFDELFMLGLERDNDLPLRAHIGTREGKKGASPLSRSYLLVNLELDRVLYRHGLFTVAAGPVLDVARAWQPFRPQEAGRWYRDGGAQVKLRLLGDWEARFSYGRDLLDSRNAYYLTVTHGN